MQLSWKKWWVDRIFFKKNMLQFTNIFPKFEIILFPIFDAFIDVVLLGHRQPVILV